MAKRDKDRTGNELTITYQSLGTITLDEQKQAIWEDIQALSDEFGVSYLNSVELVIRATNEFGDPVQIRRLSTGATVRRLDTHHYRPACLDYKL
ncbi:MAG: hypothetical protein GC201_13320 [Alphaproteobacteria bacterium]|jgi:hypothetical protein|nr:hypothetical protein [Alphaproteobacteria bacterium]